MGNMVRIHHVLVYISHANFLVNSHFRSPHCNRCITNRDEFKILSDDKMYHRQCSGEDRDEVKDYRPGFPDWPPYVQLGQLCAQLTARTINAAENTRSMMNDTCPLLALINQDDVRTLLLNPMHLGLVALWRLRRVSRVFRSFVATALAHLRLTIAGASVSSDVGQRTSRTERPAAVLQIDLGQMSATAQDKNIPEQQRERLHPPLYIAVKKHDIALVVQMLQEGIDPNDPAEWTPLFMGAGARSGMRGPLHFSSIYQAFDIAKALLTNENGPVATVDAVDAQGHTALYYAALNGNVALAKLLLAHGADYTQYKQCRNDCNLPSPPPVPSP